LVRDRLKAGDDDKQVLDFLTARYGDFVLLKPRFAWRTAALWGTPAAILVFGGLGLVLFLRRRAAALAASPGLTPAEQQRVEEILRQES
jgi:cytochrome c-type biogenesis protein CcmH